MCHRGAGFSTSPARFGAIPAMFHAFTCMHFAFFCATRAYFGAKLAKLRSHNTVHAHDTCCCFAKSSAFKVELNATGKHFYIFFLQAGRRAMIALGSAFTAGIDTFLVMMLMIHRLNFYDQ
jgi:hypothetical protein